MREDYGTAYLAAEGYEELLEKELKGDVRRFGRLFLTRQPLQKTYWAQNVWLNPFSVTFDSISEAAGILKAIQRNWALYPFTEHRRAALIEEKLPYISKKPFKFPVSLPQGSLGSWTLLNKHTLLASPHCTSLFPNGAIAFEEEREEPPSRAYLKLFEALTLLDKRPGPGDKCLEIGASPGGWTWVLANLGAHVLCVDRSPLAPNIAALPNVDFRAGNAFNMTPDAVGEVDWIFSDVACYPEKLFEWVQLWVKSGLCRNYVCTLKFQGDATYEIADSFASIPNSKVLHLSHNKHELTWMSTC